MKNSAHQERDEEWNALEREKPQQRHPRQQQPPSLPNPLFLDTIPEDASVKGTRQAAALSTASAVASSEGDDDDDDDLARKRRYAEAYAASEPSDVSATPALLGGETRTAVGGTGNSEEQAPVHLRSSVPLIRRPIFGYILVCAVLVAVAIAIYFIASSVGDNASSVKESSSPTASHGAVKNPTASPAPSAFLVTTIPPAPDVITLESEAPSPAPTIPMIEIQDIDQVLLNVSTEADLLNSTSTQSQCRNWLLYVDRQHLRVQTDGAGRIQQRYILCILYYSTNGPNWNITADTFLNPGLHECEWTGVTCHSKPCNDAAMIDRVAALILEKTSMVGTIPEELVYLSDMNILRLFDNQLGGTLPANFFSQLSNLWWLDVSLNKFHGLLPSSAPTSQLQLLYLLNNQFSGTLPSFSHLKEVWAQHNRFQHLDSAYPSLPRLEILLLRGNQLAGTLPTAWNASKLQHLDLALNPWVGGDIPTSLWMLPRLKSMILSETNLQGTLPTFPTASNSLGHVWLDHNQLHGPIPTNFGQNWVNLSSMLLHNNTLTGTIGHALCASWPSLKELETDCSMVICACCTACS